MREEGYAPKIGDWVRIRDYEDMAEQFGVRENGDINCQFSFVFAMRVLCGQEFQITEIKEKEVFGLPNNRWVISVDMVEPAYDESIDDSEIMFFLETFKA